MRVVSGGGYTLSFAVRRPTITSHHRRRRPIQLRAKTSSGPQTDGSSGSGTAAESPKSTALPRQQHSTSASTAAGASIPSVPERPLRRLIRSSLIGKVADAYGRAQDRRPYWTQLLSTLVIYLCGDLAAQLLLGEDKETTVEEAGDEEQSQSVQSGYDPLRTARHVTVGAVAAIPVYKWFMFLHNNFNFSSRAISIATKVLISQSCFAPAFNTYFFSTNSLLAGASFEDTWERLKVALPTSLLNSVKIWPAVTAFTFAYVDPRFRSIFTGVIAVGWQSYLSWLHQKATKEVDDYEGSTEECKGLVGAPAPAAATAAILQK